MKVFFYGLFMDTELLKKAGVHPLSQARGFVDNYTIEIGERATLARCDGAKAYGVLMELEEADVRKLYAETSVADYMPEEVDVKTDSGSTVKGTCYILHGNPSNSRNQKYAEALYKLAKILGFPKEYLDKIR